MQVPQSPFKVNELSEHYDSSEKSRLSIVSVQLVAHLNLWCTWKWSCHCQCVCEFGKLKCILQSFPFAGFQIMRYCVAI